MLVQRTWKIDYKLNCDNILFKFVTSSISWCSAEVQFHLSLEFISEDKCLLIEYAECISYHSWLLYWFYLQGPGISVSSRNFWKEASFTWHKEIFWGSQCRAGAESATPISYWEYWYTLKGLGSQLDPLLASCALPWEAEKALRLCTHCSATAETLVCFQTYELLWRKLNLAQASTPAEWTT